MYKASVEESVTENMTNNASDSLTGPGYNNEKRIEYTKMTQSILSVTSNPEMVDLLKKVERHGQETSSQSQSE